MGGGVAKVKKCRISWLAFVYYYDWSRGQPFVPRENTSKVDKIDIEGLGRWWSSSWSNSACERARDLIFFLNPRFLGMGNHLGPLPEASDGPEGQELPVRAVGGQGELREVTQLLCKLEI